MFIHVSFSKATMLTNATLKYFFLSWTAEICWFMLLLTTKIKSITVSPQIYILWEHLNSQVSHLNSFFSLMNWFNVFLYDTFFLASLPAMVTVERFLSFMNCCNMSSYFALRKSYLHSFHIWMFFSCINSFNMFMAHFE